MGTGTTCTREQQSKILSEIFAAEIYKGIVNEFKNKEVDVGKLRSRVNEEITKLEESERPKPEIEAMSLTLWDCYHKTLDLLNMYR
ncbi:hypothetical protein KY347_05790 [Candidatus Woesearchaeota archaeon]|nr:hypothetical protein [Candidatus Woesearchaeota archaeon]